MLNATQQDFRSLELFVQNLFSNTPETEYNEDAFAPLSGQVARLSWYVNGQEAQLQILLFDDNTHSLVRITPNGRQETERKENPSELFQISFSAFDWNADHANVERIARYDAVRQANLRNRFNA